ncbi:unnamed protein product [Lampetra fluviatilis]
MMQAHSWNSPHHHTHGGALPHHHTHGGAPPHHHKHGGTPTTWPNGPVVRTHAGGPVLVASPLPRPPPAWRRARATAQGAALLLLMALLVLSVLPRPLRYQDGHAGPTDPPLSKPAKPTCDAVQGKPGVQRPGAEQNRFAWEQLQRAPTPGRRTHSTLDPSNMKMR